MRLVAIYNVWADWDILKYSLKNIEPLVDGVIIVASTMSNYGEFCAIPEEFISKIVIREPQFTIPMHSETDKRNFGLKIAREQGYTHFLTIDSDEFYKPDDFLRVKGLFQDPSWEANNIKGSVCTCTTFFKSPTLSIGLDVTLVPFIHELTPTIKHEFNRRYPCAWNGNQILIDPTRSYNINTGVVLLRDVTMFHMSWVRSDYERKIRNSSARANLERSTIRQDLVLAEEGKICNYYGKTLVRVPNLFNIPEYGEFLRKDIQPISSANPADKPHL